jgi:hypothetical protein
LPGDEDRAGIGGRFQGGGLATVDHVEVGGDGGDLDDLTRGTQLVGSHVGETDMPDQALLAELRQSPNLVLDRGVFSTTAVQVLQVDPLDTKTPGAQVRTLSQLIGIANRVDQGLTIADGAAPHKGRSRRHLDALKWLSNCVLLSLF